MWVPGGVRCTGGDRRTACWVCSLPTPGGVRGFPGVLRSSSRRFLPHPHSPLTSLFHLVPLFTCSLHALSLFPQYCLLIGSPKPKLDLWIFPPPQSTSFTGIFFCLLFKLTRTHSDRWLFSQRSFHLVRLTRDS